MKKFQVTKDCRVFLDDVEITKCLGFRVNIEAAREPVVELSISVREIWIEGYTVGGEEDEEVGA